ncbi:MAG TPA: GAF domain-containing sensor histidine kinase [Gemmatimonadales bacterium]|nr:GAF domain-containing sensor histidine kinase [Gemmatimonadales bacterium]
MQAPVPATAAEELHAALLQAGLTAALAALCAFLYHRYHKPYFAWWAAAWALYVVRIGAITSFLLSGSWIWLYWHQVATGWTALALLYAALVFAQGVRWRPWYLALVLFPPAWSYVAIYRLDQFLWAAGPAVLFLSLATLGTGWAFIRYRRRVDSSGATLLAVAFVLWGLHHLDYPFLRARGAWTPWGYYLDIVFSLAIGAGILLLVVDDQRRGLGALSALSGDLQRAGREEDVLDALLSRPLTLPAVRGTALFLVQEGRPGFVRGAGVCAGGTEPDARGNAVLARALATGRPQVSDAWSGAGAGAYPYAAVLPLLREQAPIGALVLVSEARDPFTALDDAFLVALGQQVGSALAQTDLYRRLATRTGELTRLSARMVQQHEAERRRLSRELHDETAQVFSAVKMELGVLREGIAPADGPRLDQILALIDAGIRTIRNVTNDLRPSLLDDLGLLPALRSLAAEFAERSGVDATFSAPASLPGLSSEAELALFRALQEALANVARHAEATTVEIGLSASGGRVLLQVRDDGRGFPAEPLEAYERRGHMGLAGMRERIGALGGSVRTQQAPGGGALVEVSVPVDGVGRS